MMTLRQKLYTHLRYSPSRALPLLTLCQATTMITRTRCPQGQLHLYSSERTGGLHACTCAYQSVCFAWRPPQKMRASITGQCTGLTNWVDSHEAWGVLLHMGSGRKRYASLHRLAPCLQIRRSPQVCHDHLFLPMPLERPET